MRKRKSKEEFTDDEIVEMLRKTLCPQCGFYVPVDEDGCCLICGNGATGAGVNMIFAHFKIRAAAFKHIKEVFSDTDKKVKEIFLDMEKEIKKVVDKEI